MKIIPARWILGALLFVTVSPAVAQSTTITASQIQSNVSGTLLPAGYLVLTPVNSKGVPTGFTAGGGGQVMPQSFFWPITNGSITGVIVPDTSLISPSGICYRTEIDDGNRNPLYTYSQPICPTGTTWSLDTWFPTSTATVSPAGSLKTGSSAPTGGCNAPTVYYLGTTFYNCIGGVYIQQVSGSNATQLQGFNIAATAPSNGQSPVWVTADNQYEPQTPIGGVSPSTTVNGHPLSSDVTLGFSDLAGTIPSTQLPTPTTSLLGGVLASAAISRQWINQIGSNGAPALSQPAFTDISGTVAPSQLPQATSSAFGAIKPDGTSCTTTAGILSCPGMTTLTGDVGASGTGSVAATVTGLNGQNLQALGAGMWKLDASGVPHIAVPGTDYVAPATTVNGHALSTSVTIAVTDIANAAATNSANTYAGTQTAPAFASSSPYNNYVDFTATGTPNPTGPASETTRLEAPSSVTAAVRYILPTSPPTGLYTLLSFPAPSGGVSQGCWASTSTFVCASPFSIANQKYQAGTSANVATLALPAFTNALTAGSLIVVHQYYAYTSGVFQVPTDTAGNTYQDCGGGSVAFSTNADWAECFYTLNTHTTASDIVTIRAASGCSGATCGQFLSGGAFELLGAASSSPIDGGSNVGYSVKANATGGAAGANNLTATALTPAGNGDLIISFFASGYGATAGTSPNLFSQINTGWVESSGYFLQASSAAITATASDSESSDRYAAMVIAVKP